MKCPTCGHDPAVLSPSGYFDVSVAADVYPAQVSYPGTNVNAIPLQFPVGVAAAAGCPPVQVFTVKFSTEDSP